MNINIIIMIIIIIILLIIIISTFKQDNVFSMAANLPYGPPVIQTLIIIGFLSDVFLFCKCCEVSCAIFVGR